MNFERLGRSGLTVSRICLGTMTFGGRTDEHEAGQIYKACRDAGINFLDTADVYTGGESERITGRLIAHERDQIILATKVANAVDSDPNHRGLSRRWVREGAHGCLKRLGTSHLDVLYLHKEDHFTPLEETVRALEDLVRAGDVHHIGVSNHRAWRMAQLARFCDEANITRPVVCQPYYHALYRAMETEVLPACAGLGMGVVSYSPVARGVLTGKYSGNVTPDDSRVGNADARILQTEFKPETIALADQFVARAKARGGDPAAYAIAFVLANPIITGAIAGPRTLAQMEAYFGALDVEWTEEDEAFVNSLVPAGSTAVHHYVDPAYPVEGRPARAQG